jgi:DNA polymerase III alpha subunit
MVFERFISEARNEPPDIDIDFEHERRQEIIDEIYRKYGDRRAALCATVIHYRTKGAIRDVGKVMGLSKEIISSMAENITGWDRYKTTN